MNDILFGNNNKAIVKKITRRELAADRKRNFFIVAAILLTAFMIASVFSIGMSYYETFTMSKKRIQGSISQMAFEMPTEEQLSKVYTLDYIDTVGIGAVVATTDDIPGFIHMGASYLEISYVDQTQWEKMFCPTYTNIIGHYAEKENEIMLSRYLLDILGIEDAEPGMTIPLSFEVDGTMVTEDFVLACTYTEYAHIQTSNDIQIYCSKAFAEKYHALETSNLTVNIVFKDDNVAENIERLKADLPFYEDQPYIQSPVYGDTGGSVVAWLVLGILALFLMFAGYLLIYNVMYISVSRDVRFFGMLKTVGTTPRQIRRIVIGQVLRLCLIGLPLGCLAALGVSLFIVPTIISLSSGTSTGTIVSFSPLIYIGAIIFSMLTAWVGAVTPAKKAAGISPMEALRYAGEKPVNTKARYPLKGKPFRMALRNVFRDRKRAVVVMLSLFLSITVFTSVMTVINGIDIDNYVNSVYDYDFCFSADMRHGYFLSEDFIEQVQQNQGITDTFVYRISSVGLQASESLAAYAQEPGISVAMDGSFLNEHAIRSIDPSVFDELNSSLPVPIDNERFERGEIAIINVLDPDILGCFDGVSTLEIKRRTDAGYKTLVVGGVVNLPEPRAGTSVRYSIIEILVSGAFFQQYIEQPHIAYFGMNVEGAYEAQIYNALKEFCADNGVSMWARYEGRLSMQDTKNIMLILGGGISLILGFIGAFNYINVISVGVMSRRHELATLESIGMGKKQLRSMLRFEGIGYALITLLFSVTIGNLIGCGIFRAYHNLDVYAVFDYPTIPVLIVYAVVLIVCLVTPELAYRNISKDTLVERLRQN